MLGVTRQAKGLTALLTRLASNGKQVKMKPFNPAEHNLPPDFILTNYTKMKG
jgi:hypothetical protein